MIFIDGETLQGILSSMANDWTFVVMRVSLRSLQVHQLIIIIIIILPVADGLWLPNTFRFILLMIQINFNVILIVLIRSTLLQLML